MRYCTARWLGTIFLIASILAVGSFQAAAAAPDIKAAAADRPITVQGVVFNDTNGDGVQNYHERGIANVIVSDGLQVTQTDRTGHYVLAGVKLKDSRSVFVVTPSGYRNVGPFYQTLATAPKLDGISFALAVDPERAKPNFSFGQITDLHVTNIASGGRLAALLKQMAQYKPTFVVATGDLVNQGDAPAQYLSYETAVRQSPLPIISGIGNHDLWREGPAAATNFTAWCAPTYFAFDCGGRHFLMLDSMEEGGRQQEWIKKELALQPPDKELLVFQHYPPGNWLMDILSHYHTLAIFTGHRHTSRVCHYGKILYVNTPPFIFGGIDLSPRTFRLVSFKDGKLRLDDIFPEVGKHETWVQNIARPRRGRQPAAAAARTLADVSARCRSHRADGRRGEAAASACLAADAAGNDPPVFAGRRRRPRLCEPD